MRMKPWQKIALGAIVALFIWAHPAHAGHMVQQGWNNAVIFVNSLGL